MDHDERESVPTDSVAKARAVAEAVEAFVDELNERGVKPDEWEETCLCHAVSLLFHGRTELAMNAVLLARIPKAARVADASIFGSHVRLNRTELLAGLVRVRTMTHTSDFKRLRDALIRINEVLREHLRPERHLTASATLSNIVQILDDPALVDAAGLEPLSWPTPRAPDGDQSGS